MIKVYHGTISKIEHPLVGIGRDNLDFGKGFYVTTIKKQARQWAEIKGRYHLVNGIINTYWFDDEALKLYRYKRFESYDKEWLNFIVASRTGKKVWQQYDIIEGGVANDSVIDTVEGYIAGTIDEEHALGLLAQHAPNNQICILKQAIVEKYLRFIESVELK